VNEVAVVMIGIDPHKGSHTAVAIDESETPLGRVRVRATMRQAEGLRQWAHRWPQRTWAVEGARGLGQLLTQQLLAVGERVVDVPPKLGARVRLLDSGQINKTDENDARSVAVAALRARRLAEVSGEDPTMVLRVWSSRHHDLGRLRTQAVCRLHAVLCELVAGGVRKHLSTIHASVIVDSLTADSPIAQAKLELARDLVADLQRLDAQRREVKRRIVRAVSETDTSISDIYGVGPIVAATVLGQVRDIRRFPDRDRFGSYNGTAPIEVSSGDRKIYRLSRRGNRHLNHAIHVVAVAQISHPGNPGHTYYQRKRAEGMTGKCALRALKRKVSDTLYDTMRNDTHRCEDPGGQSGNDAVTSVAGSHPDRPALRRSHSRVANNSKTATPPQPTTELRPAADRRRTSRSAAGVQVEPRPSPRRGPGQERP
jgi:transposase